MKKVISCLIAFALSLTVVICEGQQSAFAVNSSVEYSLGEEYSGVLNAWIGDEDHKFFYFDINDNSHLFITVKSGTRYFEISVYDTDGNRMSDHDTNTKSKWNDAGTVNTQTHSCNLKKGRYYIELYPSSYMVDNEQFTFIATAEPEISLSPITINSLNMPKWGTVAATFNEDANALGYETQFSLTTDFSSPIVVKGISNTATASGFSAGPVYARTRSYASYNDGTTIYSGWSKIRAIDIPKLNNKLNVAGRTANVKLTKLKKSKQVLSVSKVITFINKGQGKKTYTISSVKKGSKNFKGKIIINKKTGKVTVKKGLKKGTYKVKVKVKAAGNKNYKTVVKTVTFKIKIK